MTESEPIERGLVIVRQHAVGTYHHVATVPFGVSQDALIEACEAHMVTLSEEDRLDLYAFSVVQPSKDEWEVWGDGSDGSTPPYYYEPTLFAPVKSQVTWVIRGFRRVKKNAKDS
tara:strand:+ start:353 stop:697 length:345 start_codon:yes stop_codon:yes gene_type:complete